MDVLGVLGEHLGSGETLLCGKNTDTGQKTPKQDHTGTHGRRLRGVTVNSFNTIWELCGQSRITNKSSQRAHRQDLREDTLAARQTVGG